jgi:hypothetical protein
MLRRVHYASDENLPEGEHRSIDWTCTWLVQGHARHLEDYDHAMYGKHRAVQDHDAGPGRCTTCGARTTWVRPYIKGPDGLPLKQTKQVYRLAR